MSKGKRAITLAGGGPAAGLHIGVLEALRDKGITFEVWALSCIGAWVGIVYNQCNEGKEVEETYEFFKKGVFRDDELYKRFPINSVFGVDWFGTTRAMMEFLSKRENYDDIWVPHKMMDAFRHTMSMLYDRPFDRKDKWDVNSPGDWMRLYDRVLDRGAWFKRWNEGDINNWVLNDVMAVNPFVRFFTSMMYLSKVTGLSRIYYPDSEFMKKIRFERIWESENHIFHNAWNLSQQKLALFSNKPMNNDEYSGPITSASLCACSALPYIEETVNIDGDTYCEGALVDTVNFKSLLKQYPNLEEIWVSRIVDADQVREPKNLHDALANLCQLFAATVGEDDVKLFKYHVQYNSLDGGDPWKGTVVEIRVSSNINFSWSHNNLDTGRKAGYDAAIEAYDAYMEAGEKNLTGKVRFINEEK